MADDQVYTHTGYTGFLIPSTSAEKKTTLLELVIKNFRKYCILHFICGEEINKHHYFQYFRLPHDRKKKFKHFKWERRCLPQ